MTSAKSILRAIEAQKKHEAKESTKEPEKRAPLPLSADYSKVKDHVWTLYEEMKEKEGSNVWDVIFTRHYPFSKITPEHCALWSATVRLCEKLHKIRCNDSLRDAPKFKVRAL